jgi:hypothetical protein
MLADAAAKVAEADAAVNAKQAELAELTGHLADTRAKLRAIVGD